MSVPTTPELETPILTEHQEAEHIVQNKLSQYIGEDISKSSQEEHKSETAGEKTSESSVAPVSPKEEPEDTKKIEDTPPINTDVLAETITQKVTDNVIKALTAGEAKKEEDITAKSPWAQENRDPKSIDEIIKWVTDITKDNVEKSLAEKQKLQTEQEQKQETERQKQIETTQKEWNTRWDNQIETLQSHGKLPKTEDGVRNFWSQVKTVNEARIATQQPLITDLNEFYLYHYKEPVAVAGADAPITGPNTSATSGSGDYTWKDIRNARSLSEVVLKK